MVSSCSSLHGDTFKKRFISPSLCVGLHVQLLSNEPSPSAPYLNAPMHIHGTVRDDNCVPLVDPQRLAGAEQCHLAPIKTKVDLGMFKHPVLTTVRPPRFLDLKFILLRVRILHRSSKYI
jgi:hypothetical protein